MSAPQQPDASTGATVRLRNARTADGRSVDISVVDGLISTVSAVSSGSPVSSESTGSSEASGSVDDGGEIDLGGWLVLSAMAEPHAHLDKAMTADAVPNPAGDLMGAIDAWIEASVAGRLHYDDRVARATAALDQLLIHGVTAVRTHVDVNGPDPTMGLRALREAQARFDGLIDLQITALPSSPITGPDGAQARAALRAALELGVDHVGGCPHLDTDGPQVIAQAIEAATEAGIGIDLHVDEMLDPSVLTLRDYARQVIDSGFDGPVSAGHCVTLGMQPVEVQAEVAALVAEAGIAVFPLPQTNLFLQGRDHERAVPRGLTAIDALVEQGALVAAGADNVQDPFNLMGRSDPMETAALLVMAGHRSPDEAYTMVSTNPRRALGLPAVGSETGLVVGAPADLVAIDAPSVRGAVAQAPMSRRVFRAGRPVASSEQRSRVHRPDAPADQP